MKAEDIRVKSTEELETVPVVGLPIAPRTAIHWPFGTLRPLDEEVAKVMTLPASTVSL